MSARFERDRITGAQLAAALREIGMTPKAFARIFGMDPRRLQRTLDDEPGAEAPPWVPVVLALLLEHPGNVVVARRVAAETIRLDRERPELGEYPFKRHDHDD